MSQLAQQIANGIMDGSTYGLIALGLTLTFGVLEIAQFAIGAQAMMVGHIGYICRPNGGDDLWHR